MTSSRRPHPPETVAAIRAAAAQGMHGNLIARTLRLAPNTVKTILAREKISVVTGRPGRKVGASGCHRKGVAVPGWVPSGLIPDYIAAARMYGEEKAASIVRRLKAEATR